MLESNIWQPYKDKGVMVFGLADHTDSQLLNWIQTYGLTHPVLNDNNNSVYWSYGDGYIPYNVVLDQNFKVRYTRSGYSQNSIISVIETYLSPVFANLDAVSESVPRGGTVYVTATVTNNLNSNQNFDAWVEVILPGHSEFSGNPLAMQKNINLPGDMEASSDLAFDVPMAAPVSDQYWLRIQLGDRDSDDVWTSDLVNIEITN